MADKSIHAVLMGDIVHSEKSAIPDALHRRFNDAIDRQNQHFADDLTSPLTITLGDEFQGLVNSLVAATLIAREIRLELLAASIDCRFAIGITKLNTPVNTDRAWNMMGAGLSATRERLNEKRSGNFYRFVIPDDALLERLLDASGATLTRIEQDWSDTQRSDIVALLHGEDVAQIAQRRNVTVHNIYKVRSSGNFDLYVLQWRAIHQALIALDTKNQLSGAEKWSMRSFIPV